MSTTSSPSTALPSTALPSTSLPSTFLAETSARLKAANAPVVRRFIGESAARQPVHTVYGGAQLFKKDAAEKLGRSALKALDDYAPDADTFARATRMSGHVAEKVYVRVRDKLAREPVEDLRIDFEDGYGNRPDTEEDADAVRCAHEVASGMKDKALPPFIGIRIKTFSDELFSRSVRTLDLFVTALAKATGGALPDGFVITLPKITTPEQVGILADLLEALEGRLGLPSGELRLEVMIEATQSILSPDGTIALPKILDQARGRCVAAHFGTYDYTASNNITAAYQSMEHPACDFARTFMTQAYAGTGLWLSDGATNVMPVPVHRGEALTPAQQAENVAVVHAAWALHVRHIRHSLENGYYQGWDLHPAQLPTRYGALYGFFLEALPAASERLSNFVAKAAQATLVGDVFDDAATGQGLLNFFLRGINCGALTEEEALKTGLTVDELRGRSFLKILHNRRGA
jgi:citrate lyase beta subunit